MKYLMPIAVLLTVSICKAQLVQNIYFANAGSVPCAADSGMTVTGYHDWLFYQTLNDQWDGPKDSSICISIIQIPFSGCKIALNQIDPERRLFIVSRFDTLPSCYLSPHGVFNLPLTVAGTGNFIIELGMDSTGPLSYTIARTEIPDSTYSGVDYREQKTAINFVDSSGYNWDNVTYNTCLASEKFDEQYLRQVIAALKFSEAEVEDTLLLLLFGTDYMNYPQTYSDIIVPASGNDYVTTIGDFFDPTLIIYDAATYPSAGHIDEALITPSPNPDTIAHMTVYNEGTSSLILEPFTTLRAAEVNGQPGVYHTYTLVNDGGEICANFIEVIFHQGDEFRFQAGEINLNASPSCFRFMNGATLRITSGSELNYGGSNNSGILLLNDDANLIIESGATLNVWNRMMLREEHPEEGAKQFYMSLEPGATLRFMPGSHLTNLYSADNSIKLNVFMNGGTLDDDNLSGADKALINRIYDQQSLLDGVSVFPNPVATEASVVSNKLISEAALFDVLGQLVSHEEVNAKKMQLEMYNQSAGIYFLRLKTDSGIVTRKIQKL